MNNTLDGFEVIERIPANSKNKWDTRGILEAFLGSGEACIGKRYGDDANKVACAFRAYIRRMRLPAIACQRGDMVILMRKEASDG